MQMTPEIAKSLFTYNQKTGQLRWKTKPGVRAGSVAGRPDNEGYIVVRIRSKIRGKREEHRAHRLAWMIVTGEEPPALLDHKNGNRADNRWCNIRPATRSQNAANTGPTRRSSTGFRGVTKTRHNTYQAAVCCNRKQHYLGCYATAKKAAEAYDEKARELFGPYAKLNFPSIFKTL